MSQDKDDATPITKPFTEGFTTPWSAAESFGGATAVDRKSRVVYLPFEDTKQARNVRRFELARSQWQPTDDLAAEARKHKVTYQSMVHAVRAWTAAQLMYMGGLDLADGVPGATDPAALLRGISARMQQRRPLSAVRAAVYGMVELFGTSAGTELTDMLKRTPLRALTGLTGLVLPVLYPDEVVNYDDCDCDGCVALKAEYGKRPRSGGPPGTNDKPIRWARAVELAKFLDSVIKAVEDSMDGNQSAMSGKDVGNLLDTLLGHRGNRLNNEFVPWGRMRIDEPPRPIYHPQVRAARRRRSADTGLSPRAVHRLYTDGRVFSTKTRLFGGSLLIDASGSMSMEASDIMTLLKTAPQAIVAAYSGNYNDGVLRIMAKGGRVVDPSMVDRPSGGSNVIDLPALKWLAKQPKPRVWVSDGHVTGVGDYVGTVNSLQATTHCKKYEITRLDSTGEAIRYFEELRQKAANR